MWSSCPWVSTMPRMLPTRSCSHAMSGITRSTPSISCSGNISPVSMTTMSSPQLSAIMLRPISPRPPSGIKRELCRARCVGQKRSICRHRRLPRPCAARRGSAARASRSRGLGVGKVAANTPHVGLERLPEPAVVERRSGVIQGDVNPVVATHPLAVQARDAACAREQSRQRVTSEQQDHVGLERARSARRGSGCTPRPRAARDRDCAADGTSRCW